MGITSGAHGRGESVESKDGGEEQHVQETNHMSLDSGLERLSLLGELAAEARLVTHQHCLSEHYPEHQTQHFHHTRFQPPALSHHPPFHPPPPPEVSYLPPNHYQPPVRPHTQTSDYPPLQKPLGQQSYQHTQPSYHQPFSSPSLLYTHPLISETPHQQPYNHSHYQILSQSLHMDQPPYQHSSPTPGKHTYQHPQCHQTPTMQSSQFPPFSPHPTSFNQASVQAPVQPIVYPPLFQPTGISPFQPFPQSDSPLGKYALFLRGYYVQHHAPCTKWPPLNMKKYVNLAVINNVYANRADLVKFRKQTIRGSIDDILEWKAPIRMKDILKPNIIYDHETCEWTQYQVTQLLIEGAPGIGKSTFAWEVCQKWGQHQLFNEYSLVLLLKFRDKRVQEAKSISDLFYHPNSTLQSEISEYITTTGGHGLLLILEGFDEAPASKRAEDSLLVRIFRGQEIPMATVILTTRPSVSAGLLQFCNSVNSRRIEILGFGKKEINEYIQCAFSDEQSRSDFIKYLSLYPHIHSMMYVPLNSAIVTHVYEYCKSSGIVVPKTMTQLYSSLMRTLLLRYLKDKEEYKDTCTNINSFKDLPQPVYDQFCEICKIAYTGIMSPETELIFQDLPSDFDSLGLMQTCPELFVDSGESVSYNFLHLTLQEYLAAYHISQQSRDEQVVFMREHIQTKDIDEEVSFLRGYAESKKLELVVRFLAGVSKLGRELWEMVTGFGSMFIEDSFLEEETDFIRLEILHWLFESQDPLAITSMLSSDCVCCSHTCYSTPFDLYVLGYCITHSSCDWKLELLRCTVESVEMFLKALNLQQDQCVLPSTGMVKELWLLSSDRIAIQSLLLNLPKMAVFHNLTHLGLIASFINSETCDLLSKHTDLLQNLEYLDISANFATGRGSTVNLITSLTNFSRIKKLRLYRTRDLYHEDKGIGFEDCKALSELLTSSKYIKLLSVGDNKLSSDSIQLIVDGLSYNTSLEILQMNSSNFNSDNVLSLASVLRVNTSLKELNISDCNIQSADSVHLAKALEENITSQLQVFWVDDNPIGLDGAVAFSGMLTANRSLGKLNMTQCSIQEEGAICLAKAMEKNSSVREFDISGNTIGSESAVCFANMLKKNQSLKRLRLSDDSVGVVGALELIECLKHNTTLEELELSEKCKPPSFDMLMQDRIKFGHHCVVVTTDLPGEVTLSSFSRFP